MDWAVRGFGGWARWRFARIAAALLALAAVTFAPAQAQIGYDRRGGDYTSFIIRSGDPIICAQRCDRDSRCRAWSFAYPGVVGPRATCWLKADVPTRAEADCCVSGVRGSGVVEPRAGPVEFGIDRPGGDYRTFETAPQADGHLCAQACEADKRCRAWTYLRAGYFTTSPRCYLKSRVTRPLPKPCCVSGAVR